MGSRKGLPRPTYKHPLKQIIGAMGITQREFAQECGISLSTINNIISGRYRGSNKYNADPRHYETVASIAAVLKVSYREAERICNGEALY